jgi:hypothetical protein
MKWLECKNSVGCGKCILTSALPMIDFENMIDWSFPGVNHGIYLETLPGQEYIQSFPLFHVLSKRQNHALSPFAIA